MAKEVATFNRGVESSMMHDNIRKRIQEQCGRFVYFFNLVLKEYRWSLLRFVVVIFLNFRCANDYTMVGHMFLLVLNFIRG
jgi:hypothetical protein